MHRVLVSFLFVGIFCLFVVSTTRAFCPLTKSTSSLALALTRTTSSRQQQQHHDTALHALVLPPFVIVDGALLADGAVAVASFAAGVLTQVPRVQQLEQNVTDTQAAAAEQIQTLEARLYALDQEYEQGTQELKNQFDELRETQLQRQKRQQADEYQYKLQAQVQSLQEDYQRQLQEQKSALLSQQLQDLNGITGDRQVEMMQLRLAQTQLQERNAKLTQLLEESQVQIEEFKRKEKNRFLALFGFGDKNNNNNNKQENNSKQEISN